MPRLASLYLPTLPTDRIRRRESDGRRDPSSPWQSPGEGDHLAKPDGGGATSARRAPREAPTPAEDAAARADCSCPRGDGWRPGARWAENSKERVQLMALKGRMAGDRMAREREVEARIAALPPHQRPQMRELGRRTEPAPVVFKSSPSLLGEGGHAQHGGGAGARSVPELSSKKKTGRFAPGPSTASRSPSPAFAGEDLVVTAHRSGSKVVVAAACARAQAQGLAPGMPLTQARALFPGLHIHDADPDGDALFLRRLALLAARRWTPRAAVADETSLFLDLTGVDHLFGGEERMCARILAFCARLGLAARIAVAGTYGAAHAFARHARQPITRCPTGAEAEALAGLPVAALRLDEAALGTAARLGLDRIGDLLIMPRGPLQRRFGSGLLTRLDQALGRLREPIDPVVPEDPPTMLLRFMEPIASAEVIAGAMAEAMRQLIADLTGKGLAARAVLLTCTRVDNEEQHVGIGTARATRDGAHLLRLLTPRIETIDPGFGIERMRLTATRVEPLGAQPIAGALAGDTPAPDLVPLIDRLAGRLGARRLYRMSAVESDVPERSARPADPLEPTAGWPAWPRPVRMLSRPEPILGVVALLPDQPPRRFTWRGRAYHVARADGPERIHGEWWRRRGEAAAVRDYFAVEDEAGRRFWVFRKGDGVDGRTGDLSWWLQGVMG